MIFSRWVELESTLIIPKAMKSFSLWPGKFKNNHILISPIVFFDTQLAIGKVIQRGGGEGINVYTVYNRKNERLSGHVLKLAVNECNLFKILTFSKILGMNKTLQCKIICNEYFCYFITFILRCPLHHIIFPWLPSHLGREIFS